MCCHTEPWPKAACSANEANLLYFDTACELQISCRVTFPVSPAWQHGVSAQVLKSSRGVTPEAEATAAETQPHETGSKPDTLVFPAAIVVLRAAESDLA